MTSNVRAGILGGGITSCTSAGSKRRRIEGDGRGPSNSILIVRSVYETCTASHIGGSRSVEPPSERNTRII